MRNQHTWFRDDGAFKWVDNSAAEEEVVAQILAEIERPEHQGMDGLVGGLVLVDI